MRQVTTKKDSFLPFEEAVQFLALMWKADNFNIVAISNAVKNMVLTLRVASQSRPHLVASFAKIRTGGKPCTTSIERIRVRPRQSGGNFVLNLKSDTVTTCQYHVTRLQLSIGCVFNYAG